MQRALDGAAPGHEKQPQYTPNITQWYVAQVLAPVQEQALKAIIYHYMDDVLVCAQDESYLDQILEMTIRAIEAAGFEVHPDKIQRLCPLTYLGLCIQESTVAPQQLTIADEPRTLWDLQQLCGTVNWVRLLLRISAESLALRFNLLRGDSELNSLCTLTPEARKAIGKVQDALSPQHVHRMDLSLQFIVMGKLPHFQGLIFQWDDRSKEPLLMIEWVFLPHTPSKSITTPQELMVQLIKKARSCLRVLAGCNFACIYSPFKLEDVEFALQSSECLQFTLDSYSGQLSSHPPAHKLLNLNFRFVPKTYRSKEPL